MKYMIYITLTIILLIGMGFITAAGSALGNVDNSLKIGNFINMLIFGPIVINLISYLIVFFSIPKTIKSIILFIIIQCILSGLYFVFVRYGILSGS
ncbi:hypothetical protein [Litchfieldia alkalitelluris]|uniref:hypothetical protein n=1 Tax=Litchfieldia alkalitelluris TaxID=304268 RepID=UPI001115EE8D|nr:hypothetical protein [Litchfieldia alkalitelluris]